MSRDRRDSPPTLRPISRHRVADYLFRQPVPAPPILDVAAWTRRRRDVVRTFTAPGAQAIVGGFLSDRLAWAFAAGYQAALRVIGADRLPLADVAALCVTEAEGNTPRHIHTHIERHTVDGQERARVRGRKAFVTLGEVASQLLVVGRIGDLDGRPRLAVVQLEPTDPGVRLLPGPATAFTPEVRHAALEVDAEVPAARVWPVDGWDKVVKPFGALEDALVHAAIAAWMVGAGRQRRWPAALLEALASSAFALSNWDDADDLRSPAVWRVLEGDLERARSVIVEAGALLAAAEDESAERWRRDQALLGVARGRRAARAAAARRTTEPVSVDTSR